MSSTDYFEDVALLSRGFWTKSTLNSALLSHAILDYYVQLAFGNKTPFIPSIISSWWSCSSVTRIINTFVRCSYTDQRHFTYIMTYVGADEFVFFSDIFFLDAGLTHWNCDIEISKYFYKFNIRFVLLAN